MNELRPREIKLTAQVLVKNFNLAVLENLYSKHSS